MSNTSDLVIENGVLKKYVGHGGDVIVPDGVTSIGDLAFLDCDSLMSITLLEGVTTIGESAFSGCKKLKKIDLPDSVTSIGIGAFSGCENLVSVILPEGLTCIGESAFYDCKSLIDITLPDGVTSIGDHAFSWCESLTSIKIPEGVTSIGNRAFEFCSSLTSITLPEGLTSIGDEAFSWCYNLIFINLPNTISEIGNSAFSNCSAIKSITLPDRMTSIGKCTFAGCENLTEITLPESVVGIGERAFEKCRMLESLNIKNEGLTLDKNVFGKFHTLGLIDYTGGLWTHMTDACLKQYVLVDGTWDKLDDETRASIFLSRQGKSFEAAYMNCVAFEHLEPIGEAILARLSNSPSTKECNAAGTFMTLFYSGLPEKLLNRLYAALKKAKSGSRALKAVEAQTFLMERLGNTITVDSSLAPVEQRVSEALIAEKCTAKELAQRLKEYYSLTYKDLPQLRTAEGTETSPDVLAWLLTAHETKDSYGIDASFREAGLRPEAADIVALLDQANLQDVLLKLANMNLGLTGKSKKMYLAFPICRYADEATMAKLTERAPQWRSTVSGNDAPPLATFRKANVYSNTRSAMLFSERYHELDRYAWVHNMSEDAIRDHYLSDVGLDEQRGKSYDLGNQTVTARLQKDLSFLVELPDGKTAKSLPKKGADPDKYEAANKDFSEMKKSVKKILKNRGNVLFEDFLSGRTRKSADWQDAYLHNPLLRQAAGLVVWAQGKNTFTLTDSGAVDSTERPYSFTDKPIKVAHPMEMTAEDIKAWQDYFTLHGLKQPFAQVWEPVRNAGDIREDRYKGIMIPYYRFNGQEKRGITVRDYNFHNDIDISILGCNTDIVRIDFSRHDISMNDRFEIRRFGFGKFTRRVNHIVAYLDRITVGDRVRKDDVTVMDMMNGFTLAQITEFIAAAQEANATNVLAALLEYKNANFAEFDPMDEFTLEW